MNADERAVEMGVAICTHNPDEKTFRRTLAAVESLEMSPGTRIECVVVDNNSDAPVSELPYVKAFLGRCTWARAITEGRKGLTYARIAAIEHTTALNLCFVDDDNEPAKDYLAAASRILTDHRCIAVIGPGKVVVNYMEPVSDWFAQRFSHHFQERDCPELTYGRICGTWTDYYPPGSCMVVRRDVLERYRQEFLSDRLSALGRVGTKLSSGDDTQIVWEAVKMGFAAGISPELRINHLITAKRSNLDYVKRLCYGTSSSYLPALVSSFPSKKAGLSGAVPSNARIVWRVTKIILRHLARLRLDVLPIELASFFGSLVGVLKASETQGRTWVYRCVALLRLD
jgi:glycosyltransferase involved in cell wall biosynthesis